MISNTGNVLVYNGEIYNFIELKNDLKKNYQINFLMELQIQKYY